jgi:16S rRNA (guanine527-N7)-methyltransferase
MDVACIADRLAPFLPAPLSAAQLAQLATYLELLLRWNRRFNLTAVREAENIVTRHFGESLFAAAHLFPPPEASDERAGDGPSLSECGAAPAAGGEGKYCDLVDVGSGAGFPGMVVKIWRPSLRVVLIEAQQKKASFLREVIRQLGFGEAEVMAARAETAAVRARVVTLRAVEQYARVLPVAASLLHSPVAGAVSARLALLIGQDQVNQATRLLPTFSWQPALPIPESVARVLLVGSPV